MRSEFTFVEVLPQGVIMRKFCASRLVARRAQRRIWLMFTLNYQVHAPAARDFLMFLKKFSRNRRAAQTNFNCFVSCFENELLWTSTSERKTFVKFYYNKYFSFRGEVANIHGRDSRTKTGWWAIIMGSPVLHNAEFTRKAVNTRCKPLTSSSVDTPR